MIKKRIYYLVGLLVLLIINYLIQDSSKNLNDINVYQVLSETLRPIVIFLLMGLFFSRKPRAIVVPVVLALFMVIEFIIRYNSDTELIKYNELIGLLIGSTLLFAFEQFKNKQTNRKEKQIT